MALNRITRSGMQDTDRMAGEYWTFTSTLHVHEIREKGASA
jgi:hypothetical protein